MRLSGKTILITGAAKRIGRAIALELARSGGQILIHYNKSAGEARELKRELESWGARAWLCPLDLSNVTVKSIRAFVRKLPVAVDALVNNASAFYPVPIGKLNDKNWNDFMTVNLKAPVFLAQELGLQMVKRGEGRIVNVGDLAGENPFQNFLPHSVSKGALHVATKSLAKELAPNVLVNAVLPGPILEPPFGMSAPAKKRTAAQTLLKRFGQPEDIAKAVRYLLEADFVTGELLKVDGGKSIS